MDIDETWSDSESAGVELVAALPGKPLSYCGDPAARHDNIRPAAR
jgi:hypothetical protein